MSIITVAGYYGTGSSAVADLLKEYKTVSLAGHGYYEIRFIQDPDGISDLFYNIVENNHRHNTSNAIKRFIKYLNYLNGSFYTKRYRRIFGNDFLKISLDYVDELCELKSKSWWHGDEYNRGELFNFIDLCYGRFMRIFRRDKDRQSLLKNREYGYFSSIGEEKFCAVTKQYIDRLFSLANTEKTMHVLAEQLIPPSNIERYLKFFTDLKVVVVERDPRDVYIACKEVYDDGIVPAQRVEDFCSWYIITRNHRKNERFEHALFVNFEDLIIRYSETVELIEKYVGLNPFDHTEKGKFLKPVESSRGINLISKYPKYAKDIEYIERVLAEYLYEQK